MRDDFEVHPVGTAAKLAEAKAEIDRLREVLTPFAEWGTGMEPSPEDSWLVTAAIAARSALARGRGRSRWPSTRRVDGVSGGGLGSRCQDG